MASLPRNDQGDRIGPLYIHKGKRGVFGKITWVRKMPGTKNRFGHWVHVPYLQVHERYDATDWHEWGRPSEIVVKTAYTLRGEWIGDYATAFVLCRELGVSPRHSQKDQPSHCRCVIGFSQADCKMYGWGHRGVAGFRWGDEKEKGDLPEPERGYTIRDVVKVALDYAEAVA